MSNHDPDNATSTPPLRLVRDGDVAPVDQDAADRVVLGPTRRGKSTAQPGPGDQVHHEPPAAEGASGDPDLDQAAVAADKTDPSSGADTGTGARLRRVRWTRGRRAVVLLAVVVLALAAWSVHDRLTSPDAGATGTTPVPVDGGQPSDPHAAAATKTAITYWTAVLALDADTACPLDADEASCRSVLDVSGGDLGPLELAEPIEALQTQAVTTGGGVSGDPVANTAVLLSYVITGRDAVRVAVLVRDGDGRVLDTEHIGPDESGMTLAQVFAGQR